MRHVFTVIVIILCIILLCFSSQSMIGAARGFELFITNVFPALFPFTVCVQAMKLLGIFEVNSNSMLGNTAKIFLLSAAAGWPTGSFLVEAGFGGSTPKLSKNKRSILSALCNLSNPAFIIGTVAGSMLGRAKLALLFLVSHYGTASILVLLFTLFNKKNCSCQYSKAIDGCRLSEVLPAAIENAVAVVMKIGGAIVFFSVVTGMLDGQYVSAIISPKLKTMLCGLLEMTNGISRAAASGTDLRSSCALISFMLSFGGICIAVQSMSVAKTQVLPYLITKLVQGLLSALVCFMLFPLFYSGANAVINGLDSVLLTRNAIAIGEIAACAALTSAAATIIAILFTGKTRA